MMEEENPSQDSTMNRSEISSKGLKKNSLLNGIADEEMIDQTSEKKLSMVALPENGVTCNGSVKIEDTGPYSDCKGSGGPADLISSPQSGFSNVEDHSLLDSSEVMKGKISVQQTQLSDPAIDTSDIVPETIISEDEDNQNDCGMGTDKVKISKEDSFTPRRDTDSKNHKATKSEANNENVRSRRRKYSSSNEDSQVVEVIDCSRNAVHNDSDGECVSITDVIEEDDVEKLDEVKETTESGDEILIKEEGSTDTYVKCSNIDITPSESKGVKHTGKSTESAVIKIKDTKEEVSKVKGANISKRLSKNGQDVRKNEQPIDISNDDIEIIGESRVVKVNKPDRPHHISPHVTSAPGGQGMVVTGSSAPTSSLVRGISPSPVLSQALVRGISSSPMSSQGFIPGRGALGAHALASGFAGTGGAAGHNIPLFVPPVAPPKPKSSLDQIELIRWEIQNRISTRPKYFKPCPNSELGPLAKFLFDIGSDLIKEAVYHDLVKIQSKKNNNDKLNDKEKQDLGKLKQIEKDLCATIGHLKLKLKKKCKVCNFQTESNNVMLYHKQYPHEDNKFMRCAICSFVTKQAIAFKSHMESGHGIQAKLNDKKAFHECDLCPYENNQEQKLTLHKQRCIKQFRPLFNLHPSCLSGAEINLCLENIFYRPVIPKNLKLLQQKHAQQQAALAEAKRQQAEMQALAVAKKATAVSVKKQQMVPRTMPAATPRFTAPPSGGMLQQQQQPVRYNANSKGSRLTVANMLNNKQNPLALPTATSPNVAPGGFEVCEMCGGYVKDRKALRIHFFYAHRIDLPFNLFERAQAPLYCATCYVRFWTAQGLRKHIDSHKEENQTRGVVGKCISCGHHVLNLLLHMRVVHNREMQHYVHALVCMFCGSHFGTQQECERHITAVHGHVDPVTGTLKSSPTATPVQQVQKAPPNQKKTSNSSFVKGSVCVLCNLNFGRNVDLTRHCMRMHHTCMKCGMVVIDKASLMKHTCLSSPSGTRDCSLCGETGFHPAYYVKHLRDKHLKKFTVSVNKLSSETIDQWTRGHGPSERPGEEPVVIDNVAHSPNTLSNRPKIGPACKTGRSNVDSPAVEVDCQEQDMQVIDDDESVLDLKITLEGKCAGVDSQRSEKRKLLSESEEPSKKHKPS